MSAAPALTGSPPPATTELAPVAAQRADRHPALVYLARLAPSGRRTMRRSLDVVAGLLTDGACDAVSLPWPALTYAHTAAVRRALAERFAPSTANKTLSAMRSVLRECWRLGLADAEQVERACDLAPVRGDTLRPAAGRALTSGELAALFAVCDPATAGGARDAAALAIMYGAGLRRSEAVSVDLADYDGASGALTVRHAKGNKARQVWLLGGAAEAVEAWIAHRGDAPGPLLAPVDRIDRVTVRRMSGQALLHRLRRLADRADVARFSPHDCRRSMIGDLLDAGADIVSVQRIAGHASPTTTSGYDRRPDAARRRAAGLLHVPYAR